MAGIEKEIEEYLRQPLFREALAIPADAEVTVDLLAQGEYNINYVFQHPVAGKRMVLRVNTGSQMHLADQIGYEYRALQLLESSGRTPRALYVDGSRTSLDYGVMVMEFLEGRALDYRRDMERAAACLADIHSVPVTAASGEALDEVALGSRLERESMVHGLLAPQNPLQAILEECDEMVQTYYQSNLGSLETKRRIERLLEGGRRKADQVKGYDGYRCCINTELNSGNFLINEPGRPDYLVDWEKPLYGDPAQDLGHFLAPTTTFWKTDVILDKEEERQFTAQYEKYVEDRFDTSGLRERLEWYIPVTCLRGITWSAMAWVQYQETERLIRNEETFRKMEIYLSKEFLDEIAGRYDWT